MVHAPNTIPVISIVGKGDSGKTTFLEKLIREMTRRGTRVGTVKHHIHDYDIDVPGKDSWRHSRAGAVTTMVSSPRKFALIRETSREYTLHELAEIAHESECDILLTEGFKLEGVNRVEVSRMARSDELLCSPNEVIAYVTDNPSIAHGGVPVFALDDATGVANLIQDLLGVDGDA